MRGRDIRHRLRSENGETNVRPICRKGERSDLAALVCARAHIARPLRAADRVEPTRDDRRLQCTLVPRHIRAVGGYLPRKRPTTTRLRKAGFESRKIGPYRLWLRPASATSTAREPVPEWLSWSLTDDGASFVRLRGAGSSPASSEPHLSPRPDTSWSRPCRHSRIPARTHSSRSGSDR